MIFKKNFLEINGKKVKIISSLILFTAFTFVCSPHAFASYGLVEHVPFNEGAGSTTYDTSDYGNNGTWQGTPAGDGGTYYVVGRTNNTYAGTFNGTDNFVQIPDSAALQPTTAITIGMWFKKTRNGSFERLLAKVNNIGSQFVWGIQTTNTNQFQMFVGDANSNSNYHISSTKTITDTNWHYYTAVYDATSNTASLYIDGVLDTTGALVSGSGSWTGNLATSSGVLDIGKFIYNSASYFAQGDISDVQVYNQALTSDQIYTTYQLTNISGVGSYYGVTVHHTLTITPDCSDLSGTVTYTSSDPLFWDVPTHTWSFTPIFEDGGTVKIISFSCTNGITTRRATSTIAVFHDFSKLTKYTNNPIIPYNTGSYNSNGADTVYLRDYQKIGNTYYMVTQGDGTSGWCNFVLYTSSDLINWTPYSINPVLTCGASGTWDDAYINHPSIIKIGSTWYMYYSAQTTNGKIGLATSSDFIHWTKSTSNPIYSGNPSGTDAANLPSVIQIGGVYYMYYWNMGASKANYMEYATSSDGITWSYGGVALPRNVTDWDYSYTNSGFDPWIIRNNAGFYEMVYTIYGGSVSTQELGYAVSTDGINWYKYQGSILNGSGVSGTFDYSYPGDGILYPYENYLYLYYAGVNSSFVAQGALSWIQSTTTGTYEGITNIYYADGNVAYDSSPQGQHKVSLSASPTSGSISLTINTWNISGTYEKTWTAALSTSTTVTYSIGELSPQTNYMITVDGVDVGAVTANGSGHVTYLYSGNVGNHQFVISKSTTNSSQSITSGSSGSSGTVQDQYKNLMSMGFTSLARQLKQKYLWLFDNTSSTSTIIKTVSDTATQAYFARYLKVGMYGTDVLELQKMLNQQGFTLTSSGPGSPGHETDFFGSLTKAALIRYQDAHHDQILLPAKLNKGTGYFGYYTLKYTNSESLH